VRVLWLDPGEQTGVCLFNADTLKIEYSEIIEGGQPGFIQWYRSIGQSLALDCEVVGCESFELEEGTHGVDLTPVEIIAWLKPIGVVDVWQRRNQRGKGKLITPAVLKRAGLYPKRGELKEGHQVAALQHALSYLVRIRHRKTIELLHPKEQAA
jgi:hypothetical protein